MLPSQKVEVIRAKLGWVSTAEMLNEYHTAWPHTAFFLWPYVTSEIWVRAVFILGHSIPPHLCLMYWQVFFLPLVWSHTPIEIFSFSFLAL